MFSFNTTSLAYVYFLFLAAWTTTNALMPSSLSLQSAHHAAALSSVSSSSRLKAASDNNIVLSPSDDPEAFDSLKIGGARVHRYSLSSDPDSQTEYVMWYHGRYVLSTCQLFEESDFNNPTSDKSLFFCNQKIQRFGRRQILATVKYGENRPCNQSQWIALGQRHHR